ncbi:YigZ family protein [Microbacterium phyllosphaerae]
MTPPRSYPATIAAPVEHEIVIKKSRFIATVEPVGSVDDADAVISRLRKKWWDARHNCSAMVTGLLGDQARSSDDGEPSGTAGCRCSNTVGAIGDGIGAIGEGIGDTWNSIFG